MNRNNGAQSSCVLLTMIISGCQHCWLWGFKIGQHRSHSHFQAFQVQTDHRLLCITGRPAHQFSVKGFHRFLQPGVCTQGCRSPLQRSAVPQRWVLAAQEAPCSPWSNPCRKDLCKIFAQHREGRAFLLGWAFLQQQKSPHHCPPSIAHLHITVLWANPAPGLLFPAHSVSCSLNFCIWKKKAQISTEISPPWQPLQSSCSRWSHVWGVWFHHRPGFKCKPFNRVKLTVPKSLGILPDLLSVFWALLLWRGLLSSRQFPWINRAQWHTELSHLAGIQWVSPYE